MIRISSHLNIFKLKSEPLWKKNTWSVFRGENKGKMNGSNFEPSQNHMHMLHIQPFERIARILCND